MYYIFKMKCFFCQTKLLFLFSSVYGTYGTKKNSWHDIWQIISAWGQDFWYEIEPKLTQLSPMGSIWHIVGYTVYHSLKPNFPLETIFLCVNKRFIRFSLHVALMYLLSQIIIRVLKGLIWHEDILSIVGFWWKFGLTLQKMVNATHTFYRVSHSDMVFLKWLWRVKRLRIFMIYL